MMSFHIQGLSFGDGWTKNYLEFRSKVTDSLADSTKPALIADSVVLV